MSIEMHVFLKKSIVPDRESWQDGVSSLGLPLVFDPELTPLVGSGFSPAKLKNVESGFEMNSGPAQDLLQDYPHLANTIADRDWCISFRWSGDLNECACVLAASAGLVKLCNAIAFYPEDDLVYDLNRLVDEAKNALSDGRG
jgi:hypothetical protein